MGETAANFLTALAQVISTMALYESGHPARERAVDAVHEGMARLKEEHANPAFTFLGLSVGVVQEEMTAGQRRSAYEADITYATAKEVGFDFLRDLLVDELAGIVHRPFHYAIVDEADSI